MKGDEDINRCNKKTKVKRTMCRHEVEKNQRRQNIVRLQMSCQSNWFENTGYLLLRNCGRKRGKRHPDMPKKQEQRRTRICKEVARHVVGIFIARRR
jgi:hypothetical protein